MLNYPYIARAILFVCWTLAVYVSVSAQPDDSVELRQAEPLIEIDRELLHAETYYWFGMAEQGNMSAFRKGLGHLATAEQLLAEVEVPESDRQLRTARIEGLRVDLDEQMEIAHDTLFGVFPLTRFITQSLFAESTILDTFEVIDDPNVMATTFAAKKLALTTITEWKQRHQLDVVFTSVPHNPQLENEALYVFNTHPKFFVHNLREVTDALTPEQLAVFQAGVVTPAIKQRMLDTFQINDLLVVLVRQTDVVDDDYFYILEGDLFNSTAHDPVQNFAVMGFSRDRNRWFNSIVMTNVGLLAFAFLAFWLQARIRRRASVRLRGWAFVVLPFVAFIVGRATPWFVGPLLKSISPVPETLAIVSFWVPAAAGLTMTIAPMAGFWLVSKRLAKIWPLFSLEARLASVFVGIGAGFAAFLSVSILLFLQESGWQVFVPAAIAIFGVAYLFGRALDSVDQVSSSLSVVPCLLSLPLGVSIFLSDPTWLWTVAGMSVASCFAAVALAGRSKGPTSETSVERDLALRDTSSAMAHALDGDRLGELAERPTFQRFEGFETCRSRLEPLLHGRTVHLALHGGRGCGLSETATMLSVDIVAALRKQRREVVEMHGECPQAKSEPKPYAPFRTALAQHFEIELLGSGDGKSDELDAALGDVFQSVVPFAGVLFPASSTATNQMSSGEDIAASIAWMLERMAKRKAIVLVIDDAQWLDDASRELLRHLLTRFPAGGLVPIAIVVASHQEDTLDTLELDSTHRFAIQSPGAAEQIQILTGGIGLTKGTARAIVDRVGSGTIEQGGLFWLLQVVSSLARHGAFMSTDEGVALNNDEWPGDAAIPTEMREVLAEQLRNHPQYRTIIQCAVCASQGREFPASLVAQALGKPTLDLLVELDRLDRETSILYDVRQRDDIFAFQSSFMLDVVRQELQIDRTTETDDTPQIIREHHARLGSILEREANTSPQHVYQTASHFHAAGPKFADKGLHYSLQSVEAACSMLDFATADYYLKTAEDCGQAIGSTNAVEAERLYVECLKAHVTGQFEDHRQAAELGTAYLTKIPDCSTRLLLAIAQAHYDAGKSSGDNSWFERSLEIGKRLIDEARSPQDQASGHHFVGISLPPPQADERKSELRRALEIIESASEGQESLELLGRILGALGMELSRGAGDEQQEAKRLFQRRLALIDEHKIGDLRGQAMTHGGLGRLAFYADPPDIAEARLHFEKDLELSKAIDDQQGQIQMHSLLGACALSEDDVPSALNHYEQSWQLAHNAINRFFAGAGLLSCFIRSENRERFGATVEELQLLAKDEGIPSMCVEEVAKSLGNCPEDWIGAAVADLKRMMEG